MITIKKSFCSRYGCSEDKTLEVFIHLGLSMAQDPSGNSAFTSKQREDMETAHLHGWRIPTYEEEVTCFGLDGQGNVNRPCPNDIYNKVYVRDFQG